MQPGKLDDAWRRGAKEELECLYAGRLISLKESAAEQAALATAATKACREAKVHACDEFEIGTTLELAAQADVRSPFNVFCR